MKILIVIAIIYKHTLIRMKIVIFFNLIYSLAHFTSSIIKLPFLHMKMSLLNFINDYFIFFQYTRIMNYALLLQMYFTWDAMYPS